jgi:nicotinate-nucleotide--dimethylbenzimidazole phosphoribosyltransferase
VGIGNSSAAAALSHCVTRRPLASVLGAGAGAPPGGIEHKLRVVDEAVRRAGPCDPLDAMREFGGYEMAAMLGAIFESVACRTVVVVDGFIATAVACVAAALEPSVRDALLFAHLSPEQGHPVLLEWLEARPLLDLGMRLGEGTGAALAIPLIRMAEGLLRTMADLPGSHPA